MVFLVILGLGFAVIAWTPVNDRVVEPWTEVLAAVSGKVLGILGEEVRVVGTVLRGRFAVAIENGCNGIEAVLLYVAAVVAFPAGWRWKAAGLLVGSGVLQVVNILRVVSLYLTGIYYPNWFDTAHTVIWQSALVLVSFGLWVTWAAVKRGPMGARA